MLLYHINIPAESRQSYRAAHIVLFLRNIFLLDKVVHQLIHVGSHWNICSTSGQVLDTAGVSEPRNTDINGELLYWLVAGSYITLSEYNKSPMCILTSIAH